MNSPVYWTRETEDFMAWVDRMQDRTVHKVEFRKIPSPEALEHYVIEIWVYPERKSD